MPSPAIRTILPVALITCSGMLAMDLYLPAVPRMQHALALTVPQAQATIAVFMAGLAVSQLAWGAALRRFGPRRCAMVLLTAASLALVLRYPTASR
jgi:DHA1 family bicyclomycin/chloramphenicol resistance-like MFS transporter